MALSSIRTHRQRLRRPPGRGADNERRQRHHHSEFNHSKTEGVHFLPDLDERGSQRRVRNEQKMLFSHANDAEILVFDLPPQDVLEAA